MYVVVLDIKILDSLFCLIQFFKTKFQLHLFVTTMKSCLPMQMGFIFSQLNNRKLGLYITHSGQLKSLHGIQSVL